MINLSHFSNIPSVLPNVENFSLQGEIFVHFLGYSSNLITPFPRGRVGVRGGFIFVKSSRLGIFAINMRFIIIQQILHSLHFQNSFLTLIAPNPHFLEIKDFKNCDLPRGKVKNPLSLI